MGLDMERRKQIRKSANFDVRVSTQDTDTLTLLVTNYSKDGLYVLASGNPMPALGSVVKVKLNKIIPHAPEPPLLDMVIKRVDSEGIGLQYLKAA